MNDVSAIDALVQKRTEGVQIYRFALLQDNEIVIPDSRYHYMAAFSNQESLVKQVDMKIVDDRFIQFDSKQLLNLPAGSYRLEIWEMVSDTIHAIFPSNKTLRFRVEANALDLPQGTVSSLTLDEFERRFNTIASRIQTGTFEAPKFKVGTTKTVPANQPATVEMITNDDGSVTINYNIPKGQDGETWEPYISEDGKWHIRLKDKGEDE